MPLLLLLARTVVIRLALLGVAFSVVSLAGAAGLKPEADDKLGGEVSGRVMTPATSGALPGRLSSQRLAVDANYRLSPGDVVQVVVFGEPTLSGSYALGPGGTIAMPQLGQVGLRGLTLSQATQLIRSRVAALVKRPTVTVTVNEVASIRKVYVSGEVARAGALTLPFGATLTDAVTTAGPGVLADLRRVRLTHPGEKPVEVDCSGLRGEGPLGAEHRLEYGDTIFIPRVAEEVTVMGEVRAPGKVALPVGQELTVLDALRASQGFTPLADRTRAVLMRPGSDPISIDLDRLLAQGDMTENRTLKAGDVLVVQRDEGQDVLVTGALQRTGVMNLRGLDRRDLLRIVTLSGPVPQTDLSRVTVYRGNQALVRDLQALMEKGDLAQNLDLQPGDLVVAPAKEVHSVLVTGAVARRGVVQMVRPEEHDLLRTVTLAGPGALSDLSRVTIHRSGQTLVQDLQAVIDRGKTEESIQLRDGDVVVVPEVEQRVVLSGAVQRSGLVPLAGPEQRDLARLVILSGPLPTADLSQVTVRRGGQATVVNVKSYIEQGDRSQTLELQDGDVVRVPAVSEAVLITGALARGGLVRLYEGVDRDLLSLVLAAGPLPSADLERVTVHRGQERVQRNLKALVENGDRSQTMTIEAGDIIAVPPRETATVLVTGAVARPGLANLVDKQRDLAALVSLSGPLANADLSRVTVHRGGMSTTRDLTAYSQTGAAAHTMLLEDGDVVRVPRVEESIILTGALARAGVLRLYEGVDRDLASLVMAAGPLPYAALENVTVYRGSETIVRNLRALMEKGDRTQAMTVEPGDIVVVPRGEQNITVTGAVARPGTLQALDDKQRDLLRVVMAALPLPGADLSRVRVHRGGETFVRDLKRLADEGDLSQTMLLQDGDVVQVPRGEQSVLIAGAVLRPGLVQIPADQPRDVAQLVTMSQPLVNADLTRVAIHRGGQSLIRNIKAYLDTGDPQQTLALEDGDVVVVPPGEQTVLLMGALQRTGPLQLVGDKQRDLARVVTASGPLPNADLQRVTVYRGAQTLVRDLKKLQDEGDLSQSLQLEDGDVVMVPRGEHAILVIGAVLRSGTVQLVEEKQRDLMRVIAMAGPTATADLTRVTVYRGSETIVRDLKKLADEGDLSQTLLLQDGDIVKVPGYEESILIAGAVTRAGVMGLGDPRTRDLARVIAAAGPTPFADVRRVTVHRAGEKIVRNLYAAIYEGDASQTLQLQDGDVVVVPLDRNTAMITGAVMRGGTVVVSDPEARNLAEIVMAASPLPNADLARVTVYRGDTSTVHDLRALRESGQLPPKFELLPGDQVQVPTLKAASVLISGAVLRSGVAELLQPEQRDLAKLVVGAAPLPSADLGRVVVFRQGQAATVNLKAHLEQGDATQNLTLEDGDRVLVPELGARGITITGSVQRQGLLPSTIGQTPDLLGAVTLALPLAEADLSQVTVHRNGETLVRDLVRLREQGDLSQNLTLEPGDLVFVPQAAESVVFMGAVQRAGALNIHGVKQRDLAHLLPTAGPLPEGDTERVRIYRNGETLVRNYRAVVEQGDMSQNAQLEPGDLVYIPLDEQHNVMAVGAIARPGMIRVREESEKDLLRLVTVLQPLPTADLSRVTVYRGDEEPYYCNLQLLMDQGDMTQNMRVEPGDVVVVPKLGDVYVLGAVARPGAYVAQPDWDLMDALTAAGYLTANSQRRAVVIRRRADGTHEHIHVNLAGISVGTPPEPTKIKAGDIVFVPGARTGRRIDWNLIRDALFVFGLIRDLTD